MTLKTLQNEKPHGKLVGMLLDQKKPSEVRAKMLVDLIMTTMHEPETIHGLMSQLLEETANAGATAELEALKEQYKQALAEIEVGPARPATFIAEADGTMPGPKPRGYVATPDGQERFPMLHPDVKIEDIMPGMTVYLDAKGTHILGSSGWLPKVGQEATFVRRLGNSQRVEVSVQEEKVVLHASWKLIESIEEGNVARGDSVLMCGRRQFAFTSIPQDQDRSHRFVDKSRLPDVVASRDIGKPHWILPWMRKRLRIILTRPDLLERFDLRPRVSVLMTGPTGTGKTLTIRAFLHDFKTMLAEVTGRDDLGSRVIRIKTSDLLSEWFGKTDQNIDALFNDIHELASETVTLPDGREMKVPIVVIQEEGEGIARRRGAGDGGVYDRVIGMMLQRLDDPTEDLNKFPLVWITTSNRPDMLDSAMWRRLAGMQARFTRLDREGFAAVLGKKLKSHYPYASRNGTPVDELRRDAIDQVASWFFSPNGEDSGLCEMTLRDGKKLVKSRRDFLTGAIVEQGVSNSIDQAVFAADDVGEKAPGLSASALIDSLCNVIDSLAGNLTAANADDYVDLPEHTAVAAVRRLSGSNSRLTRLTE
jgi:ATP-dependent 26S proteasome regulatory subunit